MKYSIKKRTFALPAAMACALFTLQTHALNIVLNDVGTSPMSAAQLAAFQEAANDWENTYSDPITVNVDIAFNNLDNDILGSTRTARTTQSYSTVRSAMHADASYSNEKNAVNALPASSLPITVFNGARNDTQITLSTANAKALNLGTGLDSDYGSFPPGVDAEITFNTDFETSFDYDPSNGITFNTTDFEAVARHEIGHALGFFSLTDVQDNNPGFVLRPNTLDVWRFEETGGAHNLGTEPRLLTAGDAEFYDGILNNVTMSHGSTVFDPMCNSNTGRCQASHWSDDQGNLMDPTIAQNVLQNLLGDDRHALNYVGYNEVFYLICCIRLIPRWDFWWYWPFEQPPIITELGYPELPQLQNEPPEWANLAWASNMDLKDLGLRSGIGFARFEEATQISAEMIRPSEDVPGEVNLNPPAEPMFIRPPALYEMEFTSDREAGFQFKFVATCGAVGCQFDRSIGEVGGYRIPGFIDSEGDGVEDVDARITLILMSDESGVPNPDAQSVFKLDGESSDSNLIIDDFEAFGLEPPVDNDGDGVPDAADNCSEKENPDQRDTDGDGFGNICDPDLNNDGVVNFADVSLWVPFFNTATTGDADFNGDGFANFGDYALYPEFFLLAPGPSGVAQ